MVKEKLDKADDSSKAVEEKKEIAKNVKKLKKALVNKSALKAEKKVIKMKISELKEINSSGPKVMRMQEKLEKVMVKQEEQKAKASDLKSKVKSLIRQAEAKEEEK